MAPTPTVAGPRRQYRWPPTARLGGLHTYEYSVLAEPYTLVSVPAAISDDPDEARRQASTAAMAMLRMFKRESYKFLSPEEVEAYPATAQEQQILDTYTHRSFHGTPAMVAERLEALHERTGVDEVMLVGGQHSGEFDQHGIELIAEHYDLPRA